MFDIRGVMNRLQLDTVCSCVVRAILDAIFGRAGPESGDSTPDRVRRADSMLRKFRDGVLARTPRGKVITEAIAQTAPDVSRVLSQDPIAFSLAVDLLEPWVDASAGIGLLSRKIDGHTVKTAHALAERVVSVCPELGEQIDPLVGLISKYEGSSVVRLIGSVRKPKISKVDKGRPSPKRKR